MELQYKEFFRKTSESIPEIFKQQSSKLFLWVFKSINLFCTYCVGSSEAQDRCLLETQDVSACEGVISCVQGWVIKQIW